ncbi:hypothetical protein BC829DRAFT_429704 [Chytridium lagenaria]|nr:hypothetical protein BC829DRAFT_429704 [Chytridium lagenaria]
MLSLSAIIILSAVTTAVMVPKGADAQFVLSSPLARGFNRDTLTTGPCGGINESVNPVNMPKATTITLSSFLDAGNYTISIGFPTGFAGFEYIPLSSNVIPNSVLPRPLPFNVTADIDVEKAPAGSSAIWAPGVPATLQVVLENDGKKYYQCADVVIDSPNPLPPRSDPGLQSFPPLQSTTDTSIPLPPSTATAVTSRSASATLTTKAPSSSTLGAAGATSTPSSSSINLVSTLSKAVVAGFVIVAAVELCKRNVFFFFFFFFLISPVSLLPILYFLSFSVSFWMSGPVTFRIIVSFL